MKNQNKVRHTPYGRKELYFDNYFVALRFIDLYKDLFVGTSWAGTYKDRVVGPELVKTEDMGGIYKLVFLMNHEDMRNIEKNLKIRRKTFTRDFGDFLGKEKYSKRFVVID